MTSEDVIHSFFVPALRLKQDVIPGQYTKMWFTATRAGDYHLFCAQFCGTFHSEMTGTLFVMEPADYARWLATGINPGTSAATGQRLFVRLGCSGCHGANSSVRAPRLNGLYGKPVAIQIPRAGVPLEQITATTIIADQRYIHDSIVLPEKEVVAGYKPIMPTFQNRVSEEEIFQLTAYIRSLGTDSGATNSSGGATPIPNLTPEDYRARTGFLPANIKTLTNPATTAGPGSAPAPPKGNERTPR